MPGIFLGAGGGGGGGASSFFLGITIGPVSPCGPPASPCGGGSAGFCSPPEFCSLCHGWASVIVTTDIKNTHNSANTAINALPAGVCPAREATNLVDMNSSVGESLCASIDAP